MIRFAKREDIPKIMEFIDEHWRKNHIMGRDRKLFDFQHCWEDEVSFVLSETDGDLTGILGYIPYDKSNRDVTLAIWKSLKTTETMQGIKLLTYLRDKGDINRLSAVGVNPKTISIYKFLGFTTGKMKQWYRLRPLQDYRIAKVVDSTIPDYLKNGKMTERILDGFEQVANEFGIEDCLIRGEQLYKSMEFVERRYFNHPTFQYIKYGLERDRKKLFVVLRVQSCNGSSLLRIIDCVGDHELFRYFTPTIDRLMEDYQCEYADCYEAGVDNDIFLDAGWKLVADTENIMPDYFAPFEQRNIDIYYTSEMDGTIFFKGDGDMDRPN